MPPTPLPTYVSALPHDHHHHSAPARSLAKLSEPIPTSPGVPAVHAAWRVCLKTLVKRKTDIYAAAGTQVTVYIRVSGGHPSMR